MTKLSVIVPVYNVEKYLGRCLQSLVNQSENDIEIIVVNDGTRDNSQSIIDEYKKQYPKKIRVFVKSNGGLSDARNYGMKYATGDYVSFLDSDDYVESDLYSQLLQNTNNYSKKIVVCGYTMEWTRKRKIKIDSQEKSIDDYLSTGLVVAWNKIYKREWLLSTGVIFPKGLLYEDTEFFCKLLIHINNIDEISIVEKSFIHYIQRTDSISYSESSRIDDIHKICDNVLLYYKENNVDKKYNEAIEYKFVKALLGSFYLKYLSIKDGKIRKEKCKSNWNYINNTFPNWKKNRLINTKGNIVTKMYLKYVNKLLYLLIGNLYVMYISIKNGGK